VLLHPDEIKKSVEPLGWLYSDKCVVKSFSFESYRDAVNFAMSVSELAERADHHPKLIIDYMEVAIEISSHSLGGVTTKCINLANSIDSL